MKLLIAGEPNSGQKEVIELLTGRKVGPMDSVSGLVLDHEFKTKYFTAGCGVWADEYDDVKQWASEFSSEGAQEVRDALVLFIHTANGDVDPALETFVNALHRPGISIAVQKPGTELSGTRAQALENIGFDVVDMDELTSVVHTALFDALDDDSFTGEASPPLDAAGDGPVQEAPRDLDDIMAELQYARESKTMSNEEKLALAERLADELL